MPRNCIRLGQMRSHGICKMLAAVTVSASRRDWFNARAEQAVVNTLREPARLNPNARKLKALGFCYI